MVFILDHRMDTIILFHDAGPSTDDGPPERLVQLGKALADPLRLRAPRALAIGPRTLGDLASELGVAIRFVVGTGPALEVVVLAVEVARVEIEASRNAPLEVLARVAIQLQVDRLRGVAKGHGCKRLREFLDGRTGVEQGPLPLAGVPIASRSKRS